MRGYIVAIMAKFSKPRDIIDRKALVQELDALVEWSGYSPKTHGPVLEIFKAASSRGWDEVRRRFEAGEASGLETVRANAFLTDQLVRTIHEFALLRAFPAANPTTGDNLALAATGGYGRGEMAPFSDIDLMFLLPYKLTPRAEQVVEFTLYTLWDMGLKVGHATRSVDEGLRLAGDDLTIRTSLLDARWLSGNQPLFDEFRDRFATEMVAGSGAEFVEAKLGERDARHDRMGDTRYVLEPNLKEGKGGLRDLQTLFWIGKYLYQAERAADLQAAGVLTAADVRRFTRAEKFLHTVRCQLHYLAGRPEERLTFNVQTELGERMGYRDRPGSRGVERFMKHYFLTAKDVGDLTRVICAVLEEQHKKRRATTWLAGLRFGKRQVEGFKIEGGRLTIAGDADLKKNPVKLIQMFHVAQVNDLDIHPNALQTVSQNLKLINAKLRKTPEANRLFMEILTGASPETALMRMNEAGVLGRFLPDFGRVIAQMQYDMYHVYTVDEHTIRAIGILHGIDTGRLKDDHPVACEVIGEVQSRGALYLAVLLHDIAKGRGGDHSELGAEIALKLGPRFGLTEWETETVSWLVRHHLVLSNTAFKRDIDDAKTVRDLIEIVQSPERLRLLHVLTIADIRAVGPNVWNGWKSGLLRELYWRTQEALSGDAPAARLTDRVERAKRQLRERLSDWSDEAVDAHMSVGNAGYWLGVDAETLVAHAELVRQSAAAGRAFDVQFLEAPEKDVTEVTVYAPDHPGLFAAIAGAIALSGGSIVDAKAHTLNTGMALDTFAIQDGSGGPFGGGNSLRRLQDRVADAIQGRVRPAKALAEAHQRALTSRTQVFKVPPRVLIDNKASNAFTVVEINGRDRLGLLHDLTAAITDMGLQISSAHISTYGERVVDVFYVKDVFGMKVDNPEKTEAIRNRLLDAIVGEKPAKKPRAITREPAALQ